MKSIPTEALEIILCSPLDQTICLARQTAYRLKCQGEWRNAGVSHIRLGFFLEHFLTVKQDRIPMKHQLVKTFKDLLPIQRGLEKIPFSDRSKSGILVHRTDREQITVIMQESMGPGITLEKIYI